MATLASQPISRAGTIPAYVAATGGGDKFTPDKNTVLHVKNGSGGSITVTIVTPGTELGLAIADVAVAIAGGAEKLIGPFPHQHFASPTDGLAAITYSGVTSLTIAALTVSQP